MRRRAFLESLGCFGAVSLGWSSLACQTGRASPEGGWVEGKDKRLKVLEAAPLVLETPLSLLESHRVTPKEHLFVRNNVDFPEALRLAPVANPDWTLSIVELGENSRAHSVTLAQLQELRPDSIEMVLQCSGNSRSLMSALAPIKGTPWSRGGVGNVIFGGVKLATVFEKLGVSVPPQARFLTADGRETPSTAQAQAARDKKDFEHSLPLDDALNRSLLALELNGEPLPAIHGGPLRLVTPGYYGTMHIKWLHRLQLTATESAQDSQFPRYRVPLHPMVAGGSFDFTLTNSRPNWRMNVKSIVFSPLPDAVLRAGRVTARGVAFHDGEGTLETVLISWDRGASWQPAQLTSGASPYAWSRWEATREVPAGPHEVWSRAIDSQGRAQPLDGNAQWNPGGYEWNVVEKIPFSCA